MPTKDQTQDLNERLRGLIEQNWQCPVEKAVPADIRPRANAPKSKACVGSTLPLAHWTDWSYKFLKELHKLSDRTAGKLAYARDLMKREVRDRQNNGEVASLKDVAEIVVSDLKRINGSWARDYASAMNVEEAHKGEDILDDEEDLPGTDGDHDTIRVSRLSTRTSDSQQGGDGLVSDVDVDRTTVKEEVVASEDASQVANPTNEENMRSFTRDIARLRTRAKIARLRGHAMRLRQEAAKREAEAYELEARMLQNDLEE